MTSAEISEWMAYDNLKDEKYRDRLESASMTDEEADEKLKSLLGFNYGNNS